MSKQQERISCLEREAAFYRQQLDWLWANCKIVAWPDGGEYPLEHNMSAKKDSREAIESTMAAAEKWNRRISTQDAALWRLREICAGPYKAKHGKSLTLLEGWVWEMVHFIHHALTDSPNNPEDQNAN